MINGFGMQLFASLGYNHFRRIIEFIEVLLKNSRNNYKKYSRHKTKNANLRVKSKEYGNRINKSKDIINADVKYHAQYRIHKKIDANIQKHADHTNLSADQVFDSYISYKYRQNSTIFADNKDLALGKQREYVRRNQEAWERFKNDESRITNLFFNYHSRTQSFRDIQSHRVAVSYVITYLYLG